ncbi:MAG TPA: hypothetical protein VHC41_04980 [Mycobacteriales bacterium]|nr:hypothetical protein [Mycobacteriales bacterium]
MIETAHLLGGVAATGTATAPPPAPNGPADHNDGVGAGTWAFLVIIGLILLSVALFYALSRSLRRARRNLGGDVLPRRRGQRPPEQQSPAPEGSAGAHRSPPQ